MFRKIIPALLALVLFSGHASAQIGPPGPGQTPTPQPTFAYTVPTLFPSIAAGVPVAGTGGQGLQAATAIPTPLATLVPSTPVVPLVTGNIAANAVSQIAVGIGTTDDATTSTGFVDATALTVTLTTTGGSVYLSYSSTCGQNTGAAKCRATFVKDGSNLGTSIGFFQAQMPTALVQLMPVSMVYVDVTPTVAAHTYKVQFSAGDAGGTATLYGASFKSELIAIEFKK